LAIDHISKQLVPANFRLMQAQEADKQAEARKDYSDAFIKFAEGIKGPFYIGDQLTLADIAIIPWLELLYIVENHRGLDRASLGPKFNAYFDIVTKLPSVVATRSEPQYYAQIYSRYLRDEAQSEAAKATRAGKAFS